MFFLDAAPWSSPTTAPPQLTMPCYLGWHGLTLGGLDCCWFDESAQEKADAQTPKPPWLRAEWPAYNKDQIVFSDLSMVL